MAKDPRRAEGASMTGFQVRLPGHSSGLWSSLLGSRPGLGKVLGKASAPLGALGLPGPAWVILFDPDGCCAILRRV